MTAVNAFYLALKMDSSSFTISMTTLANDCFAKCIKSHYEENFRLPVLKMTDLKIIKNKTSKKNNLSLDDEQLGWFRTVSINDRTLNTILKYFFVQAF